MVVTAPPATAAPRVEMTDGTVVTDAATGRAAVIVGDSRMNFRDIEALEDAGCGADFVVTLPSEVFRAIPSGPDPLYAAAQRDVDVDRITPDPQYRENCHELYRADRRAPQEIFETGFTAWDTVDGQYDVRSYVLKNQPSPFVSTTYRDDLYRAWKSPYYYYIDAPGGIDVNDTIGRDHKYADQAEVAFPGGLATRFIVKGCPVDRQTLTIIEDRCEANPHYRPWRER
ncbi:scabin-related ADP-ribosyltransferase [Stackebrandtia albiflava]|uniref:scabin-related ADP-ribosyltransferase n=1 Tax=Stackebrandtia albiflava TaxID=406432 RepID=UPI003CC7F0F0